MVMNFNLIFQLIRFFCFMLQLKLTRLKQVRLPALFSAKMCGNDFGSGSVFLLECCVELVKAISALGFIHVTATAIQKVCKNHTYPQQAV